VAATGGGAALRPGQVYGSSAAFKHALNLLENRHTEFAEYD
jgi:hypothetical protein